MSKRISSKRDLPKEFDLSKYNGLSTMSDEDVFRQLKMRANAVEFEGWGKEWSSELATYFLEHGCDMSQRYDYSDPFIKNEIEMPDEYYAFNGGKKFHDKYQKNIDTSRRLSHGYAMGGLTRYEVMCLASENDLHGERKGKPLVIGDEEGKQIISGGDESQGLLMARLTDSINMITNSPLYLRLDLDMPDDILIDDLKTLLPIWREELNIKENKHEINNSWSVVKRKVIEYRVLPYVDLICWANAKNLSIPQGVLAVALFPDGEKDGFAIAQTIKKFVENLMRSEYLEKLRREISQGIEVGK
ncbi:DUF6387 family protein [Enterobacter sp. C2]|uniref:DUF6387 family protein n=1 Tax=Enterobacter sp. C2 TaxID=2870346 RepID=UPI001CA404B6|nr:DUF6387 family protein [Enterobacter sp. C2]